MNSSSTGSHRDLPPLPHFIPSSHPPNPPSIHSLSSASRSRRSSTAPSSINDELKQLINKASHLSVQLSNEKRRADDAERRLNEVLDRFKAVNDAKVAAILDARRANSELELYKLQLETAQREIIRAQQVADTLERQRFQAEQDAAKARSSVRKLNEKLLVYTAHDEGHRRGIQEGLQRGREIGFVEGHFTGYEGGPLPTDGFPDDDSFDESIPRYSMAQSRSHSRAPTDAGHQSRSHSRAPTDAGHQSRSQSRAPTDVGHQSRRHSRAPTDAGPSIPVPRASSPAPVPVPAPAPPSLPPTSPPPVPIPPRSSSPLSGPPQNNYPPSMISMAPTPRMSHAYIPPDNFIPDIGPDNVIRIPPPYEFQRPAPTPDQPPQVHLPAGSEAPSGPRPTTPQQLHRVPHHSSPASASTTLSHYDIVQDPQGINMRTPMSIIPEIPSPSVQNLSRVGSQSLRHQPSMSGNSSHRMSNATMRSGIDPSQTPSQLQPIYTRPRSVSSSVSSSRNQRQAGSNSGQALRSSTSTVPDINIQAPSLRESMSTQQRSDNGRTSYAPSSSNGQHPTFFDSSPSYVPDMSDPGPSVYAAPSESDFNMPGGLPDSHITRTSYISTGEGHSAPVIPAPDLMRPHPSDSDAGSSQGSRERSSHTGRDGAWAGALRMKEPIYPTIDINGVPVNTTLTSVSTLRRPNVVPSDNGLQEIIQRLEESDSEGSEGTYDTLRTDHEEQRERRRIRREARGEARAQLAAQVPLPPSTIHGTPRSVYSTVGRQTPAASATSRPLSRVYES